MSGEHDCCTCAGPIIPVILGGGDRVLLATPAHLYRAQAEEMTSGLRERFPGVEFTIVDGMSGMAVQRFES